LLAIGSGFAALAQAWALAWALALLALLH